MEFHHVSVLMNETVNALVTDPYGVYVDCTLGGSGHSRQIVQRIQPHGWLIGIDQDIAAVETGKERLADATCKVSIIHNNFRNLDTILDGLGVSQVDGIMFDLGVSSHQLDVADRGFSYMHDAPLDMRMNPQDKNSAFDVVNQYSEENLASLISEYGEERWAKRISRFIVEARSKQEIKTTFELVDVIKKAIPAAARREGPHPAKRTFQAIRIEVNKELEILEDTFVTAVKRLKTGGRICIITFHSLEDRIAKKTLQNLAKSCICPPQLPVCTCNTVAQVKVLGRPIIPSEAELTDNPRARSAKLRVAEKL